MKTLSFNDKTSGEEISITYSDYGSGRPIILIHGWPLSREMWEYQVGDLVNAGYRVIKYDRRGFGKSSKPWTGYDYNSLADDLQQLMEQLDLNDAVLVGFSMGGGEVVRYLSRYGQKRVGAAVLISSVVPFLLKTSDNPDGVDQKVFDDMVAGVQDDRIDFLEHFGKNFFGIGFLSKPVSNALLHYYLEMGSKAPAHSTLECIRSFSATDFRKDLASVTVPTLLIHGDADKIVPIDVTSRVADEMLPYSELRIYPGAPHGLFYTERKQLNEDLLHFIAGKSLQPLQPEIETMPVIPPMV